MHIPWIKTVRRILLGIIAVVLIIVVLNYLFTWYRRTHAVKTAVKMLSTETLRSTEGFHGWSAPNGILKYRIHAQKVLETRQGKRLLQGIEVHYFNPDGSIRNKIRSQKAEYDDKAKIVDFSGDVHLFLGKNIELQTDSLHYDLNVGIGTTPDLLQISSDEINGTARGVRFNSKEDSLELSNKVDLNLVQKRVKPEGGTETGKIHAASDQLSFSKIKHSIILKGLGRIEAGAQTLTGDCVEVSLDPDNKRVISLAASGNATYQSNDTGEKRSMGGDGIVFGVNPSGVLDKINVIGHASFSSISSSDEFHLESSEIDMESDAKGLPIHIQSRVGVGLKMEHQSTMTDISGDKLDIEFTEGTGNPKNITVNIRAKMNVENSANSARNELEANRIHISLREMNGRSVPDKINADGSARYVSHAASMPSNPSRTLSAAQIEMRYSKEGDFLESGNASDKVVLSELTGQQSGRPQVRRLYADKTQFFFFPGNNQIKDLAADGNVRVVFEKKSESGKKSAVEEVHTSSNHMKANFGLIDGSSDIKSMSQWDEFSYRDSLRSAFSGRCDYDAGKGTLYLTGSPRMTDEKSSTIGDRMEFDRNQKTLSVHGHVRSTLNSQKGNSSFFGSSESSSPGIVTANEMRYWDDEKKAQYTGKVEFLSEDQQLQSHILEIINNGERINASGNVFHSVPHNKAGENGRPAKNSTIEIQSAYLEYIQGNNILKYSGHVTIQVKPDDLHIVSETFDAILDKAGKNIDRATARQKVVINEKNRECKGDMADWYLAQEKLIITGEPAEVRDPQRHSFARRLTSFTSDDRILLDR
jgi:LPS export ABC transporter protein LptC